MTKPTYDELADSLLWTLDRIHRQLADAGQIKKVREMAIAAKTPEPEPGQPRKWEVALRRMMYQTAILSIDAVTEDEARDKAMKEIEQQGWREPAEEQEVTVDYAEEART